MTKLFETADRMYTLPPHRFTVYGMGLILGYCLKVHKNSIKLSKFQLTIGWIVMTVLLIWSMLVALPTGLIGYKFNALDAAHYAGSAPIGYCGFFVWVIWTAEMGHESSWTSLMVD